ncbi:unnamed protein product [Trichobilharzia regenti]|nr:unnamed protein product [Trichobilharzia regenti]
MMKPIKDAQGNLISKEKKQIKQWADHFRGLLNRPPPAACPEIPPPPTARTEVPASGHKSSNKGRNPGCDKATETQSGR